jgi:outer membrane biosynthesis protein TonB
VACAVLGLTTTSLIGFAWPGQGGSAQQKQASSADPTVYRVGGDVKAPRPVSTPLPRPPARTDKQRKVVLSFVVTPDGGVRDIKVVKYFKADFDSVAVNTVAR